ncbi:MAG: DsbC family protein [Rubrivivax sp.]|nr:DsbC family protein [Rubrivivax sp.]
MTRTDRAPVLAPLRAALLAAALLAAAGSVAAQEAAIRKVLTERFPNITKIDEISRTPVPGIFEVRIGTEIVYVDAEAKHLIQGSIIELATMTDLTQARIDKLTAIDFDELPLKDAIVVRQGNGARKLAVFADPNCGFCKRFERDLTSLKDVTIYTFLLPILGADSTAKSRDIWCARDAAKVWRAWMIDGTVPPRVSGACDAAALDRNLELGRKHRVNGTPALVFEDGTRKPGALPAAEVEKLLVAASRK